MGTGRQEHAHSGERTYQVVRVGQCWSNQSKSEGQLTHFICRVGRVGSDSGELLGHCEQWRLANVVNSFPLFFASSYQHLLNLLTHVVVWRVGRVDACWTCARAWCPASRGWWVGGWVWVGDRVKRMQAICLFLGQNGLMNMKSAGILLEGLQVDDSKKLSTNAWELPARVNAQFPLPEEHCSWPLFYFILFSISQYFPHTAESVGSVLGRIWTGPPVGMWRLFGLDPASG